MKNYKTHLLMKGGGVIFCLLGFSACQTGTPTSTNPGTVSTATSLVFNTEDGYPVTTYSGQPDPPNMVFIQGGRFVMGNKEEDLLKVWDAQPRTVTVASFYMDETEIANIHWLEYLHYLQRDSVEEAYSRALPDTNVWAGRLTFMDQYVNHYLRYPGFRYFPIVGVSWKQANDYCKWRTAVVNHQLATAAGIEIPASGRIPLESGAVLPDFRLPTEAEWEYAANAMVGTQWGGDENQTHQRLYPWDGHALRNPYGKEMGMFLANFKRGRGDYAGIAGRLNDGAMITSSVYDFLPNDYGLYNMAGNVNEWVHDVYRPLSHKYVNDLNPARRDGHLDSEDGYDRTGYQSLVNDHSRVYKGGSWKDVAYWLTPGSRRFIDEDSCTATIGFRCAMIRAGTNH